MMEKFKEIWVVFSYFPLQRTYLNASDTVLQSHDFIIYDLDSTYGGYVLQWDNFVGHVKVRWGVTNVNNHGK